MSHWKMVPLGDIARPKQWPTLTKAELSDHGYPVYGANGPIGHFGIYTHELPTILIGCRGSCGTVHVTPPRAYANGNAMALDSLDSKVIDLHFLAAFFRWRGFVDVTTGTSQPQIIAENLRKMPVPTPPLPEQRRIAAILDKADAIRTKRREAMAQLDRLAQSIFIEMFGDPATNPKGWSVSSLSMICSISGEYGAGVPSKEYDPSLPRYVRITDINEDGELSSEPVSPSGTPSNWAGYQLQAGDILFARSGATVGKTYMYKEADGDCIFAGYLIRFRANSKMALPSFIFAFTRTAAYRSWVAIRQRVVAQPNINAKQFGDELIIPLPPLELQAAFQRKVTCVENQKHRLMKCSEGFDKFFASLQGRAFRGDL